MQEKIYIERTSSENSRTSIDSEIRRGLKKGIIYEEYSNSSSNHKNPLVFFINNPVSSTGLKSGNEVGGLDIQHRPIEVDGTTSPKVGLYEANSNKMVTGTSRADLGSVLAAKMMKRMSAGHKSAFQEKFNSMMRGEFPSTVNAFAYLRSNSQFTKYWNQLN